MEEFGIFMLFIMSILGIACMAMFLYFGVLILRGMRKVTRIFRNVDRAINGLPTGRLPSAFTVTPIQPPTRQITKVVTTYVQRY